MQYVESKVIGDVVQDLEARKTSRLGWIVRSTGDGNLKTA